MASHIAFALVPCQSGIMYEFLAPMVQWIPCRTPHKLASSWESASYFHALLECVFSNCCMPFWKRTKKKPNYWLKLLCVRFHSRRRRRLHFIAYRARCLHQLFVQMLVVLFSLLMIANVIAQIKFTWKPLAAYRTLINATFHRIVNVHVPLDASETRKWLSTHIASVRVGAEKLIETKICGTDKPGEFIYSNLSAVSIAAFILLYWSVFDSVNIASAFAGLVCVEWSSLAFSTVDFLFFLAPFAAADDRFVVAIFVWEMACLSSLILSWSPVESLQMFVQSA